jgi:hypothetical protein
MNPQDPRETMREWTLKKEDDYTEVWFNDSSGEIPVNKKLALFLRSLDRQALVTWAEGEKVIGASIPDIGSEFASPRDYRRAGFNAALDLVINHLKI